MSRHSSIATPLAEEIARDGNWNQAAVDASHTYDLLIQCESGRAEEASKHVESVGATAKSSYGDTVHATAEARKVTEVASGSPVRLVEELADPIPTATSEGVQTTNADQLQSDGITGQDVTVAVIDLEFNPSQSEIKDQVIGQIGDSANFKSDESGLHGTACAEIVSEMLPDADLVLASAGGLFFPSLMDDITSRFDPDVMSMSLTYKPTNRIDGQDDLSNRITEYTSGSGANTNEPGLFAVSAGNEADGGHWDGPYRTDDNGYLEFDDQGNTYLEIETFAEDQSVIVHSDNDWSSNQKYSLELYDSNKSQIKAPTRTTTPAQEVTISSSGTHYLRIKDDNLSGSEHFDIFIWGNDVRIVDSTPERSLGIPATSPDENTLTVGAVNHATGELEAFSSRGPTQDGRRGLDVVAPDGTQSDAYSGEFYGTSAACPHAAGVVGLLLANESWSNADARHGTYETARDISDSDVGTPVNTEIGYGHADAKAAYDDLDAPLDLSVSSDTASVGGSAQLSISASEVDTITIEDLWTDWPVAASDTDGATFTDSVDSQGTGTFSWSLTRASTGPSLTVNLPDRYVGGTYVVTVSGSGPDGSTETTATIDIS